MGMKDFMKSTGMGFVGAVYDLRDAGSTKVIDFSMAVTNTYKETETTSWFRLSAWGKSAEFIAAYVKKGDLIYIEAETSIRKWDDQEGNKRESTTYNCQRVTLIESAVDRQKLKDLRGDASFNRTAPQQQSPQGMPDTFAGGGSAPNKRQSPAPAQAPAPIDDDLPF